MWSHSLKKHGKYCTGTINRVKSFKKPVPSIWVRSSSSCIENMDFEVRARTRKGMVNLLLKEVGKSVRINRDPCAPREGISQKKDTDLIFFKYSRLGPFFPKIYFQRNSR